jgi:hypothetical protein
VYLLKQSAKPVNMAKKRRKINALEMPAEEVKQEEPLV